MRYSAAELIGVLVNHISSTTGIDCFDAPDNQDSPFYGIELVSVVPANTRTTFVDVFSINIHCIAAPVIPFSNAPVLRMVKTLEESLLEKIELDNCHSLFNQECDGLVRLKKDPSGEGHAIVSCRFHVCYGIERRNRG